MIFLAALGAGMMAGLFFVFSAVIMAAFERIAPASGISAMQSINAVIQAPPFFFVFFGTALLCTLCLVVALGGWLVPARAIVIAGSLAYIAGCILVTIFWNVPLNDALAATDGASTDGAALWQSYLRDWTWWNHLRTVACLISAACLTYAYGVSA